MKLFKVLAVDLKVLPSFENGQEQQWTREYLAGLGVGLCFV